MTEDRGKLYSDFVTGKEPYEWRRDIDHAASRRQQLAARGPYLACVAAEIAHIDVQVDSALQSEAEDAVREITRFDATVSRELAPLASVLLRTESASSSEIEGITAGARALAMAAIGAKAGPNAQLVTANVTAMQKALDLADAIGVDELLAAHRALLDGHPYAAPGRLRDQQVWIGSNAVSPHAASFVPPHQSRVPGALDDLIAFVHRADLPVLVQVAIAHAQFETIHPFNDGNGRTGRTLVHAMLRHAGVTRALTVPVSAGLLTDTSAYFGALSDYREGYIEPIVRQFVNASFRAVDNGRRLVRDLDAVYESWSACLTARQGSTARRLLLTLLSQPVISVPYVVAEAEVALSAAQRAVRQLEDAGIVVRAGEGRRNKVWLAPDVIEALDTFAERVGRRS